MMARGPHALHLAFDLARIPALGDRVAHQPLPDGIDELIRIAGGCDDSTADAARRTGRPPAYIRQAARLYLQHALFHAGADSYRVLGARPDAAQETLRGNFRWLMRWLHPDRDHGQWEAAFATRVLSAWEDVGSAKRRARYAASAGQGAGRRPARTRAPGPPWIARPLPIAARSPAPRVIARALAAAVALIVLLVPGSQLPSINSLFAPLYSGTGDQDGAGQVAREGQDRRADGPNR